MAVSPNGHYLVAAVEENINIWQVGTGALLEVVTRHYQPVTVLQFTGSSSHLLSGGADRQVLVWPLVLCVARRCSPGILGQIMLCLSLESGWGMAQHMGPGSSPAAWT